MSKLEPPGHLQLIGTSLLLSGHSQHKMLDIPGARDWIGGEDPKAQDMEQDSACEDCVDKYTAGAAKRTIHQPAHNNGETNGNKIYLNPQLFGRFPPSMTRGIYGSTTCPPTKPLFSKGNVCFLLATPRMVDGAICTKKISPFITTQAFTFTWIPNFTSNTKPCLISQLALTTTCRQSTPTQ